MDILYVVGKRLSNWNDNELRYSLRSLAKYGENIGRVFLVGNIPAFINREQVVCLWDYKDPTQSKHHNIMAAIEYAVYKTDIADHFLYSSDDHYYTQPTDFDNYPAFWRGVELPTQPGSSWYERTLFQTRETLDAFALPARHFAWHGNTHFCKHLFMQRRFELIRKIAEIQPDGCEPSCLMLNYWSQVEPGTMPQVVERKDNKVGRACSFDDIAEKAQAKEVISSTDAMGEMLKEWLRAEFPNKCKYER